MSDFIKTEVVLFQDMVELHCPICDKELVWTTNMEEPTSRIVYLSSCCTVRYTAHLHHVLVTSIFETHGPPSPPSTVCRCGHEEGEHSRDIGCNHAIGHMQVVNYETGDVEYPEQCGCWLYRKDG